MWQSCTNQRFGTCMWKWDKLWVWLGLRKSLYFVSKTKTNIEQKQNRNKKKTGGHLTVKSQNQDLNRARLIMEDKNCWDPQDTRVGVVKSSCTAVNELWQHAGREVFRITRWTTVTQVHAHAQSVRAGGRTRDRRDLLSDQVTRGEIAGSIGITGSKVWGGGCRTRALSEKVERKVHSMWS